MTQPHKQRNALHDLGYKIFLDRYALKDMTRETLAVGDTVIVVVNAATGQREIGKVTALALPQVTIELNDGEVVTRDIEHVDKPIETDPAQMMDRVASGIAGIEKSSELQAEWTEKFRWLLDDWKFVPGGRILTAAGTGQELSYYNCYVLSLPHDSRGGILETLKQMTEVMSRGGGVGITLSSLRPRHAYVKGVNGRSSGAVSWGALYSFVTGLIEQGGCFSADTRILTDKGLIPAAELADRMDAGETFAAHTHRGLRAISTRFRNGIKPLYEVETTRGYRLKITEDHKVAVLMDGNITTMPLKYLQEGDEILLLLGQGVEGDYVSLKPVNYERSIMSTRLNTDVQLPAELNEDLAYFLGYAYADGYVQVGKKVTWQAPKALKLATADSHPAIRERLIRVIQKLFGIQPTIEAGDGACKSVTVYSRMLIEWLQENNLLKPKAADVRVPEAIFRSPSSVMGAFIAGYFDADGCNRGKKGGFGIDSISRAILGDLQQLLSINGIVSHIVRQERSDNWQDIYRLCVTGNSFKERFMQFVKAEKLTDPAAGKRDMYHTYPASVWTQLGARAKYRQRIYDGVSERISYNQLTKIQTRLIEDEPADVAEKMQDFLNVLPDTITAIHPLGDAPVFDFEVEDVHLLSGSGIYTSNSRRGALMLLLADWHPDVFDFITSKRTAGQITNANISVAISDEFMKVLREDGDWQLKFPDTSDPDYDALWDGDIQAWEAAGRKVIVYRTIKARELWHAIIESAWASAEPGVLFLERYNKMANSWYFAPLVGVNPCVTGDTLVSTEEGYTKARDLQVGMRIRTPAGLKPIEKIYNNGIQKIFRVEFSDGGFLECTADHKLKVVRGKRYEWIAVSELENGDKVLVMPNESFGSRQRLPEEAIAYIHKRNLNVPDYFDRNLGFMIGVVTGDGTLRKLRNREKYHSLSCKIVFGGDEIAWRDIVTHRIEAMGIHTHYTENKKAVSYSDGTVVVHRSPALDCYKLASLLYHLGMPTGIKAPEKRIPEALIGLDREFLAGVLDGLFSTDGSVNLKTDNPMLRFHTSSYELAQQVRLMLLQFGIHARIYTATRDENLTYDGRSMYGTGIKYDVLIMNEGVARFYSEIGLSHPEKAAKLKEIAENYHFIGGTWTAGVVSITDTGREEEVYDVYEPDTVTWITNGYVSFDCGEQSLPGDGVCNLGAINLAKFYDENTGDVAWHDLDHAVEYAVRFLDNVVDANPYFREENKIQQLGERRVGLGTMGIAELMIYCKVRYGSPESEAFIDKLYSRIARVAYTTSSKIAAEKGSFPMFEAEKFLESGFMQQMPQDIRQQIAQNGMRNVTLLTQAPTGSTGTMTNTSTGIEPFFSWSYYRKSRLGLHEEQVPIVREWHEKNPGVDKLPDFFVTAMDLSPEEHVRVQAAFQRWIDSSISKCVTGNTLVLTDNGLIPIAELSKMRVEDGFENLEVRVATSDGFDITNAFYYGGMRETRKITLETGYEIEGTPNHQVHILDENGCIRFARLDSLTIGDTVVLYRNQLIFGHSSQNLPTYSGGTAPNHNPIRFPSQMSVDLAYVLGCITSEGAIHRNGVVISNGDRVLLEKLGEKFTNLFGLKTYIYPDKRRKSLFSLQINSRPLRNWLLNDLHLCAGAANKSIPSCILVASRDEISAFLRGLMLDGYMTANGRMFGIGLASKTLIQQLQTLFLNWGIVSRVHKAAENAWAVTVAGEALNKLAEFISFEESWKVERMAQRNENRMRSHNLAVRLPIELTDTISAMRHDSVKSLRSLYGQQTPDYQRLRVALYNRYRLDRKDVVTLYNHFADVTTGYARNFFDHDQDNCLYLQVRAIEAGFAEVFDVSVPETHTFIANGFANHNTSNLPKHYTIEQVGQLYEYMYDLGCKGGTIYRDGSRDEQILMLKGDERAESEMAEIKGKKDAEKPEKKEDKIEQVATPHRVYPRPVKLSGTTVSFKTPFGTSYITMNSDEHGNPFEVFIVVGKAGSDVQADAEAMGRMISLQLRTTAPHNRREMLKLIIDQLQNIGGARPVGFGPNRVLSLPDAVAQALQMHYLNGSEQPQQLNLPLNGVPVAMPKIEESAPQEVIHNHNGSISGADMCPECGTVSLLRAEGCRKCLTCGYTEC